MEIMKCISTYPDWSDSCTEVNDVDKVLKAEKLIGYLRRISDKIAKFIFSNNEDFIFSKFIKNVFRPINRCIKSDPMHMYNN